MLYARRCEASVLVRIKKGDTLRLVVVIAKSAASPLRLVRLNDLLVMEQTGCRGLKSRCAEHKVAVFRRNEFGFGISSGSGAVESCACSARQGALGVSS